MGTLEAIRYKNGKLKILDQLLLPTVTQYIDINGTEDGFQAIRTMQVRGAPAIAVVGVLSLVVEVYDQKFVTVEEFCEFIVKRLDYLVSARPTAVNMADSRNKISNQLKLWQQQEVLTVDELKRKFIEIGEAMESEDVAANVAIGRHGADSMEAMCGSGLLRVLTHCNAGSLATAGFGTALGVIRTVHQRNRLLRCYCTETRPYCQGSRLTAYELVHDQIPSTLICDDMVGALMKCHGLDAIVTGADRVAANGDTANKIGTYQIAVLAKYHNVPFYIAAPSTSIDLNIASGSEIVIEERAHKEMTHLAGIQLAASGIDCWNPAFDVTPAELITGGIITEFGTFTPQELRKSIESTRSANV